MMWRLTAIGVELKTMNDYMIGFIVGSFACIAFGFIKAWVDDMRPG
jgi:hypothetical protein